MQKKECTTFWNLGDFHKQKIHLEGRMKSYVSATRRTNSVQAKKCTWIYKVRSGQPKCEHVCKRSFLKLYMITNGRLQRVQVKLLEGHELNDNWGKHATIVLKAPYPFFMIASDSNKYACALFIDVSKAFHSISHKILLKKIFDYGFRKPFFDILQDFLMNRAQLVSICDTKSGNVLLKVGVPQGSVLSPLLFNLDVNDLTKTLSGCEIFQYPDDTLLV